jgi:hypothetical protein
MVLVSYPNTLGSAKFAVTVDQKTMCMKRQSRAMMGHGAVVFFVTGSRVKAN